ncbi:MAG: transaldolase [Proteobacteria bacterium]|nr:transaldolase [Pseudomonadota bacterium]
MTKIHQLNELGQSIWFDYIERQLLRKGGLKALIDKGITGVTSNPSIFEKAITSSADYDEDIAILAKQGNSAPAIYEALAFSDIREAADCLKPVYEKTNGADGFVSLEVSPEIANDSAKTYQEGIRLFQTLDRPNVMIKVPATQNGMDAVTRLIAAGVNVNVTLIFSVRHYVASAQSYIKGIKQLIKQGPSIKGGLSADRVSSVASVFISRTDSAIDRFLLETDRTDLIGTMAISVAKSAYAKFMQLFSGSDWNVLAKKGAKVQRPLWASTSTKNPDFPDTMYVDELIGPHTVNTLPPNTVDAFLDHGSVSETLTAGLNLADQRIQELHLFGIDLDRVLQSLQDQGLDAFSKSFSSLLESVSDKKEGYLN